MGRTVSIRDLQRDTSGVVREVTRTGRPAIVTNRGDPVVAVVPVDPDALEDFVLANSPPFVRAMREADAALEAGHVRPASEVFAELGEERDREPAATERDLRRVAAFTARELEVLGLLAQGRTAQSIAEELSISSGTVRTHVARILDKLAAVARTTTPATAGTP
jgi:prevent-host-death family protein